MRESYERAVREYNNYIQDGVRDDTPTLPSLNSTQAMFLMYLIEFQITQRPNSEQENNGWFPCSYQNLDVFCHKTHNQQKTPIKRLDEEGFIKRKMEGKTRYVWIDYDKFYSVIDEKEKIKT